MFEFQVSKDFRNKNVRRGSNIDIEPHEVFLDSLAKKKEEEFGISEMKFEIPLSNKVLKAFFIGFGAISLFFLALTFRLQVFEKDSFSAEAIRNNFITKSIIATRGLIYDNKMVQLVSNRPSFDLTALKSNLAEGNAFNKEIDELVRILGKSKAELEEKIRSSETDDVLLAEDLEHQPLVLLEAKIRAGDLSGFQISNSTIRDYKLGNAFSHVLGYLGKIRSDELKNTKEYAISDNIGREGLEKTYENFLRRKPGRLIIKRDAKGNQLGQQVVSMPEEGFSIQLWLDAGLQQKAYDELEATLKRIDAKKGTVIAMNPRTGGVLALVSYPGYNNNIFSKGTSQSDLDTMISNPLNPLFNRAIAGNFPSGSIIKPLIASAALQEKIVNPDKQFDDSLGYIEVVNPYNRSQSTRFNDYRPHGTVDMRKAIAVSCNDYFYIIGGGYGGQQGLGPTRIKNYLELFGWGQKSEIDLPGEQDGLIPGPEWKKEKRNEGWWIGDTYHLSIGQGDLLISPIQVITGFVAIANGGTIYKPRIAKAAIDSQNNIMQEFPPEIIRKDFINPEYLQIVREGMRDGVAYGSSTFLNNMSVTSGAKTGTAEIPWAEHYHNWITVFAPYKNPEIVLTVMIEEVPGVQAAVLPVAKNILEWYFNQK